MFISYLKISSYIKNKRKYERQYKKQLKLLYRVKELYEINNYTIVYNDQEIILNFPKIKCYCNMHSDKIQYKSYIDLKQGHKCKYCYYDRERGKGNVMYDVHRFGNKNPNWKGGSHNDAYIIRHSKEYQNWRERVFKRDNYTCQCCGDSSGHNLEAHHIENFSDHEELRFDINNGITLCKNCHDFKIYGSFHNIYSTKNNTRQQLKDYIERHSIGVYKKDNTYIFIGKFNANNFTMEYNGYTNRIFDFIKSKKVRFNIKTIPNK